VAKIGLYLIFCDAALRLTIGSVFELPGISFVSRFRTEWMSHRARRKLAILTVVPRHAGY
jgi:hypothetical protein